MSSELQKRIAEEVESIRLVDTHEHIMPEEERQRTKIDFFYWFLHYASSDLVSSGMSQEVLEEIRDPEKPLKERWEKFAPYWENIRNTAYARVLLIAAKDLFEVPDINENTYQELSEKISASNKPGWYRHVLKEKAGIEISIYDGGITEVDRDFFLPVMRFDDFVIARTVRQLGELENLTDTSIHSLDDLLEAMDKRFEAIVAEKAVGVKIGLAYLRTLKFDKVTKAEAERIFNRAFMYPAGRPAWEEWRPLAGPAWDEAKPLQDFLVHQVVRKATERQLPIQIHTGLQEGTGNVITNSKPTHLVNLFFEYPQAKFDIFHGGYPYCQELATLGKNFPNVYVDMCWLHAMSPAVAYRALDEWIETVPGNKIFAFGGDYRFVEGAYGHSRLARKVVSELLADKVEAGYFSEEEAVSLGQKILRENAYELFKVGERGKA